jgi:hypothetical protein
LALLPDLAAAVAAFLLAGAESLSVCGGFAAASLAGFSDFLLAKAGSLAACARFAAAFLTGFLAAEEADAAGLAAVPSAVCPATGCITISSDSRPAMPREASRVMKAGEDETIILPL